jgi:outer membrane protein TolC
MMQMGRKELVGLLAVASMLAGPATAQTPFLALRDRPVTLGDVLQLSLQQSPNVLLSKQQAEGARGNAMQAAGGFDMVTEFTTNRTRNRNSLTPLEQAQLVAAPVDNITSHDSTQSSTRFSVQQPLRSGLILGSDYTVQRNFDALQALQYGQLGQAQSSGRLSFSIQVPLLRNTGRDVTGASAEAAEREAAAAFASHEFDSSQTVLATTRSYWDFVAKQRLFELALESEARTKRLLEEMRKLAAADQIPQADTELVSASSAEKTAYRVTAEQGLIASRRTLARQLGMSVLDELRLSQPATPFPAADERAARAASDLAARIEAAMPRRADLRAAELREQSAQLLRVAAQHNLKPVANLSFSISEGGLAIDKSSTALASPFSTNRTGPTFSVGLQMQWPVENQQARGLLLTRSASAVGAEIQRRDLQDAVGSGIQLAASALSASVVQLHAAAAAVHHYEKTLVNENTKRRLGAGTLIDVINIEDRLNNAQQTEVLLRQSYANAIAQLLFETGELIRKRGEHEFEVPLDSLLRYAAGPTGTGEH